MLKAAIIGPPGSGKTTLFKALTGGHSQTVKTAAGHLEIHRGIVKIPDPKLEKLAELYRPKKISPMEMEYFDLVGTLESEKKQEGEKSAVLRQSDQLILVIGTFLMEGGLAEQKPKADREIANFLDDLILLDYLLISKRLERVKKQMAGTPSGPAKLELDLLAKCLKTLEEQKPARELELAENELKMLSGFGLLTFKPVLVVINVGENQIPKIPEIENSYIRISGRKQISVCAICAGMELQLSELEPAERPAFMQDLGIGELAAHRTVIASYILMDLITFYTANQNDVRAWAIPKGTRAIQAAGMIHSDMEKGFIKAEIIDIDRLLNSGSMTKAKEKGEIRLEGKEYVVSDREVVFFRFNV